MFLYIFPIVVAIAVVAVVAVYAYVLINHFPEYYYVEEIKFSTKRVKRQGRILYKTTAQKKCCNCMIFYETLKYKNGTFLCGGCDNCGKELSYRIDDGAEYEIDDGEK